MIIRPVVRATLLPMLLGACQYQRYQSDFGAAAVEDHQFLSLFWIFLGVCGFMYVLVIGFLHRRRSSSPAHAVKRMSSKPDAITNRIR